MYGKKKSLDGVGGADHSRNHDPISYCVVRAQLQHHNVTEPHQWSKLYFDGIDHWNLSMRLHGPATAWPTDQTRELNSVCNMKRLPVHNAVVGVQYTLTSLPSHVIMSSFAVLRCDVSGSCCCLSWWRIRVPVPRWKAVFSVLSTWCMDVWKNVCVLWWTHACYQGGKLTL